MKCGYSLDFWLNSSRRGMYAERLVAASSNRIQHSYQNIAINNIVEAG